MVNVRHFDPTGGRGHSGGRSMADSARDLMDDEPGLAIGEDGSITLGAFTLTPKGLIVRGRVSEADWWKVGGLIRALDTSMRLQLGDWMAYGEREWGKTYDEVAAATGYEKTTLYNLCSTCRRVKISLRSEILDIGHYAVIAALDEADQRTVMQWIRQQPKRPTVRELTAAIQGVELLPPAKGVARLAQNAVRFQGRVDKLLLKKDPTTRAELRSLAQEQAAYWQTVLAALETSE